MGSSVCLCAVFDVRITFWQKIDATTTPRSKKQKLSISIRMNIVLLGHRNAALQVLLDKIK